MRCGNPKKWVHAECPGQGGGVILAFEDEAAKWNYLCLKIATENKNFANQSGESCDME